MKVPGVLFQGAFKVLFYFVLPYGIIAAIPTQFVMRTVTPFGIGYGVFVVVIFTVLAFGLWKLGLKNYKSAGS